MRINKDTRGRSYYDIFTEEKGQTDLSINYPGTIRGFHMHKTTDEWWFAVSGQFKVVLTNPKEIIYMSEGDLIQIDKGRWHGFQVLGNEIGIMLEHTEKKYNVENPDDFKKPWNTFDKWEIERK